MLNLPAPGYKHVTGGPDAQPLEADPPASYCDGRAGVTRARPRTGSSAVSVTSGAHARAPRQPPPAKRAPAISRSRNQPPAEAAPLSRSVEDYLKAIHALNQQGEPAGTKRLARALDLQPGSVSGMVRRLAEGGLVIHERYRGARLTPDGRREALRVVRRHRIIESYLVGRLGYGWDDVHDEAERLEHAASDDLVDRMADALGNPEKDPHGAPIPTREECEA